MLLEAVGGELNEVVVLLPSLLELPVLPKPEKKGV
jgi:hypothetical protein